MFAFESARRVSHSVRGSHALAMLVKLLSGREIVVDVAGSATVLDLKVKLEVQVGWYVIEQRIVLRGDELHDELTCDVVPRGVAAYLVLAVNGKLKSKSARAAAPERAAWEDSGKQGSYCFRLDRRAGRKR